MNGYLAHWDVPADHAPDKTGAAGVMDLSDIREVLNHFNRDLSTLDVIDVGCGTGRLAQACGEYRGFDIAPGMVEYARRTGLSAQVIREPCDLRGYEADIVCCLSVFTHISRLDRLDYLHRFEAMAPILLVDILPGPEGGTPHAWYADAYQFETDLVHHGFANIDTYARISPDGANHLYFHATQ